MIHLRQTASRQEVAHVEVQQHISRGSIDQATKRVNLTKDEMKELAFKSRPSIQMPDWLIFLRQWGSA